MDARLQRRIEVVIVTTRAAASSLEPGSGRANAAVRRGIQLLEGIAKGAGADPDPGVSDELDQARRTLESMLDVPG